MRSYLRPTVAFIAAISLFGCAEKLTWKPTFAVPLAKGSLTVGELFGAQPSEIEAVFQMVSEGDSVFTYQMIYTDTLEPLTLNDFQAVGLVVPPVTVTFPEREIFLRMTGQGQDGDFQFTDPIVRFKFSNEINLEFDLELTNTFTRNVKSDPPKDYAFTISGQPTTIPAGTKAVPDTSAVLEINNTNTAGALTQVFSPTPKYLHYTPEITTPGGTNVNDGELNVLAKVVLPFTGYGRVTHRDTLPLNLNADSLLEVDPIEFAFLRFAFENKIPLGATISGRIVDSTTYQTIATLPFYSNDGEVYDDPHAIMEAGELGSPSSVITEVRIHKSNPITGEDEIEMLASGVAFILDFTFETADYENQNEVTMLSSQSLDVSVGFRTKINGNFDIPNLQTLLDTIQ